MTSILFFTDLDGSLLDHDGYGFDDARPALDRIREAGWPLVFVSSKTRAELEVLRDEIDVHDAFVVENGGGIFLPSGYDEFTVAEAQAYGGYRVIALGRPYDEIRTFIGELGGRIAIRGFGDMTVEEIADRTGLPLGSAELAARREFSEPFLLEHARDLDEVETLAGERGLAVTTGGRFHHLIAKGQDKGTAVRFLLSLLGTGPQVSVGVGDGPNDVPMLEVVDVAVIIPSASGRSARIDRADAVVAPCPGSLGWNTAVLQVIERIESA